MSGFRVSARTILHLGSELISSDGIAFYELIKNAIDAGSPEVTIDIIYRLEYSTYQRILRELGENRDDPDWDGPPVPEARPDWRPMRGLAMAAIVPGSPAAEALKAQLEEAADHEAFLKVLRAANRISISDDGEGMSQTVLTQVYLNIGTSHRAQEKRRRRRLLASSGVAPSHDEGPSEPVILGEKGLGRLSAMRLGDQISIMTAAANETRWNWLDIDWNDFADAADDDLSSVPVAPTYAADKAVGVSGTVIEISALRSDWSTEKLSQLALADFSKLIDPLSDAKLPLKLRFNGTPVEIPAFADFLIGQAHGRFTATFTATGPDAPQLSGEMRYLLHRRQAPLTLRPIDLESMVKCDSETLARVGSFKLEVYWFNRRVLKKIEGVGNLGQVRRLLAEWAGGVSLYRDGYRVNPYGNPNDDWLDLDRHAFSTSGFKLNRGQIIGRALITQGNNPYLVDQTNREGLKDTPEKRAFVAILAAAMEIYRLFLVEIDDEINRAQRLTAADAIDRFRAEDERFGELLPELEEVLEETADGKALLKRVRDTVAGLREAASGLEAASSAGETERGRVLHLASIGLMIEILAHELYRSTNAGLKTIAQAQSARDMVTAGTSLRVLDAQLRTLQKRLQVLDPLSTNARQVKEDFELVRWVEDIAGGFAARNRTSKIAVVVKVDPPGSALPIRAVKGMFVQVIENLLTNSLYWTVTEHRRLVREKRAREDDDPIGEISIVIETANRRIIVTDTGPGIPEERRERVFQPFFSTRPQKQGRGLGLYIAREIAAYHGGQLFLGEADDHGQIHSVILELGEPND